MKSNICLVVMANPRKFSEKIALHHQKQAEGTAAFEQIIREVSDATNKPEDVVGSNAGSLSSYGGGNVVTSVAPASVGRAQHRSRSTATSSSVGPIRPRPQDRKHDTSPYGSSVYLSPPPDSSWRRTNSDSALHQSSSLTAQPSSTHHAHHHYNNTLNTYPFHNASGPSLQQHHSHSQQSLHLSHHHNAQVQQDHSHRRVTDGNLESMLAMINANQNRPRSSCDMPRVPGINVYPSQDMSLMNASMFGCGDTSPVMSGGLAPLSESSVSNNGGGPQLTVPCSAGTGSLPDLTAMHFHSPHSPHSPHHHIDNAYIEDHSSSPYSSSPISASPATLSPTQLPPLRQPSARSFAPSSPGGGGNVGGPTLSGPYSPTAQNHLSVPNSNRYLHQNKNLNMDQSWMQASYQQQCSPPSLHSSHSNINVPSPTMGVPPSQICGSPNSRSPAGGSPGDSPQPQTQTTPHTETNTDTYNISHVLQQHFEQFSMMDTPVKYETNLNYVNNGSPSQSQYSQSPLRDGPCLGAGDPGGGSINSAPGGALFGARPPCPGASVCPGCTSCLAPNTPNTPTSIPDIILTDFSNSGCGGCGGCGMGSLSVSEALGKELLCSTGSDGLFIDDDGLRDGLDPVDFDGLQMLTDPDTNVVADAAAEDTFRLDRS